MGKVSKEWKRVIVYVLIFLNAYSVLKKLLFLPLLEGVKLPTILYNIVIALALASVCGITCVVVSEGWEFKQWRMIMKNNLSGWIVLVVSIIAFVVLMTVVGKYMTDTFDAIRVIVASTLIFAPNAWALTLVFSKRCKNEL